MKKLKVLLFSDADYTGGAEKYLYYLARYLPCRKHVAIAGEPAPGRLMEWLGRIDIPFTVIPEAGGVAGVRKFYSLLRDIRPDILHLNLPGPFDANYSLAAPVARAAGVRNIVTTEHLPMVHSFMKSRFLKGFATRFINTVITVSRDNRKHLVKEHHLPERKIKVVYNGIPDPEVEVSDRKSILQEEDDNFRIAVIGSLLKKKGQVAAIESLKELDPSIHLYLAGEGAMEDKLREAACEPGVAGRVHFMGYVENIFDFLNDIDVLLVPSSIEATPYTVIEGLAMGVPVIASAIFGIPEMIEDGKSGILIERENLSSAIRLLFENRTLMEDLSRGGRRRYDSQFRIGKSVEDTMNVYREMIVRRGGLF